MDRMGGGRKPGSPAFPPWQGMRHAGADPEQTRPKNDQIVIPLFARHALVLLTDSDALPEPAIRLFGKHRMIPFLLRSAFPGSRRAGHADKAGGAAFRRQDLAPLLDQLFINPPDRIDFTLQAVKAQPVDVPIIFAQRRVPIYLVYEAEPGEADDGHSILLEPVEVGPLFL